MNKKEGKNKFSEFHSRFSFPVKNLRYDIYIENLLYAINLFTVKNYELRVYKIYVQVLFKGQNASFLLNKILWLRYGR